MKKTQLTPHQVAQMKVMVEEQRLQHRLVAAHFGIGRYVVERLAREGGWKTQRSGPRSGPEHPDWKGGRSTDADGYILIYTPEHPHARKRGASPPAYVAEHRLVMEAKLGRYLLPTEVVHHLNGVNDDNRVENLEVFASNADHLRHELAGRCPRWTDDGKARIRAGVEKARAIARQRKELGAQAMSQSASR